MAMGEYNGDHQTILSAKYYATFRTLLDMVLSLNLCTTRVTYLKQVLVYTGDSHQEYGLWGSIRCNDEQGPGECCCMLLPRANMREGVKHRFCTSVSLSVFLSVNFSVW